MPVMDHAQYLPPASEQLECIGALPRYLSQDMYLIFSVMYTTGAICVVRSLRTVYAYGVR